jgi:hypothetical protein
MCKIKPTIKCKFVQHGNTHLLADVYKNVSASYSVSYSGDIVSVFTPKFRIKPPNLEPSRSSSIELKMAEV